MCGRLLIGGWLLALMNDGEPRGNGWEATKKDQCNKLVYRLG